MDEKEIYKTALATHHKLYWYTKIPFGRKNAPETFQRAVNVDPPSVKWQCAIVYKEDVIMFSKSPQEYLLHIEEVLVLLKTAGMSLKLKKYYFFS